MEKGTVELEGMIETQENYTEKESLNRTILNEENSPDETSSPKKDDLPS